MVTAMDGAKLPLKCCMIISGNKTFSTPAQVFSRYDGGAPFPAKVFLCVAPGIQNVTNISLTFSNCSNDVMDYIPVIYTQPVPGGLAICAKTAYDKGPVPSNFIEWVEIQKLLDVEKILLFDLGVPDKLRRVFQYYQKQGILEIVPYELPGIVKGVKGRGLDLPNRLSSQFSHDESLSILDCRERLAGYTYVAGIDMDEVIIPRAHQGLKSFLKDNLAKHKDAAGFEFYVQFHLTSWKKHESHNDTFFLEYQKSAKPRWECQKYIYLPDRTTRVHTHGFSAKSGFRGYRIPTSDAILHHYRECPLGWKSCFPEIIIDKEMMRFSGILQQKVSIVHKYLGWN